MPSRLSRVRGALVLPAAALAVAGASAQGLTLHEAMHAAATGSEEARQLDEQAYRLQAAKREVLGSALPSVQGYGLAGRGSLPFDPGSIGMRDSAGNRVPVLNFAQNRYSYGVEVRQPIFAFGRVGQALKTASRAERAQADANVRARQELQLGALDAYYGVMTARARLEVLDASGKRQRETVAFLESNFRMGAGMRSSVLLATASLKGLEPDRIRARRDADVAAMALNRLVGRPVDADLMLDTSSAPGWATSSELPTLSADKALENRPDLAALRQQKETLRGFARVTRMGYLPSLGFQGKWGILAYDTDQLADFDKNLEWQVGLGLQWNLFDGLTGKAKADQYASEARGLELAERQAFAMARIEIEGARREAAAADTAFEAARQAQAAAAEALELLSADFRAGKGQVTELLQAEEGLRSAEFGMLAARTQRVRSRAALRVALGMDLTKEEP